MIIKARYSNKNHSAVVATTSDRGDVLLDTWPDGLDISPYNDTEERLDNIKSALAENDLGMARVVEDVIGVLIAKGLLTVDDIPATVKDKLQDRATLRRQLTNE